MVVKIVILAIILACVGAFVVWYLKRTGKAEETAEKIKEGVDEVLKTKSPESNIDKILVDLLQINVEARTTKGFTLKMLEALEILIDKLADIIPKMNEKWPDATQTWEAARIATKHLPDFMAKYVAISEDQFSEKEEDFLKSIKTMKVEVDEYIEMHRTNALNEASTRDTIIDRKYSQAPSEGVI